MKRSIRIGGCRLGLLALLMWGAPSGLWAQEVVMQDSFDTTSPPLADRWSLVDLYWGWPEETRANWAQVQTGFGGERARSGTGMAYCAGSNPDGVLPLFPLYRVRTTPDMRKYINLAPYQSVSLNFSYLIPSIGAGDSLRIYVDNTNFVWWAWQPRTNWVPVSITLNHFAGRGRDLHFRFVSDASSTAEGAYVDNIQVLGRRPAPDAFENDNVTARAGALARGVSQSRTLHLTNDVDWARFVLGGAGAQNVQVQSSGPVGNTELELYNGMGTPLASSTNWRVPLFFGQVERASLPAGTYYVRVRAGRAQKGVVPAYNLVAKWLPLYHPDLHENDDTSGAAKSIANGETQTRTIHVPGNVDWAKFVIGRAGARNLVLETAPGGKGDTQMWLIRGATGAEVAYDDDSGTGSYSRITVDSLVGGTYFVKVQASYNTGTISEYLLRAAWTAGGGIAADAFEPDDTVATAGVIANGATQNRTIHAAGNVDWVRFVVPAGGARNVVVETAGASGDTQMWLHRGSTGAQLAYDDDSGAGEFSRISLDSLAAGTYFIKIQENGNNGTIPAYTLRSDWTTP